MKLTADIGTDQINEDLFQVIIYDLETNENVGLIYGKTHEEAIKRANKIVNRVNQTPKRNGKVSS